MRQNRRGSNAVRALEAAWKTLCEAEPSLPRNVVFVTMSTGRAAGHFVASRWAYRTGENLHEIAISARLFGSPEDVLTAMVHEGIHGILQELNGNGGCSTSPTSRWYHQKEFRDKAVELGLVCTFRDTRHGWNITYFPDHDVPARYQPTLQQLADTLPRGTLVAGSLDRDGRPLPEKGQVRLTCRCLDARTIYVSKTVAKSGGIQCLICRQPFTTKNDS